MTVVRGQSIRTNVKLNADTGKKERTVQTYRAFGCPAVVCAQIMPTPGSEANDESAYRVQITRSVTQHNHSIGESNFRQYAENRKIVDRSLLGLAKDLHKGGASVKQITNILKRRTGKCC